MTRATVGLAAAGVCAAAALRAWVASSPLGGLDADEAVWGLMTMRALDGRLDVFFWGQNYGGTHEVLLGVPVFASAGVGTASLRAVPIALFALGALLVWRIGRRVLGEPAATAAAVFYGVWPAYVVWKSTRAHGFYGAATVCALLVVLLVLRLADEPRARDASLLGLAVGLGWWATPQSAFVAAPALVWLFAVRRGRVLGLWPAVPSAVAGAAPWLAWNATHGLASLSAPFGPGGDSYLDHLRTFVYATFPAILGVRAPFVLDWITSEIVGRLVELAALALLVALLLTRRRRALVGGAALAYPFVQSLSPLAALNTEPRYLVLLAPLLALALASVAGRNTMVAAATAVALTTLTVAGLRAMTDETLPVPPVAGARVPADLEPVLTTLDRIGADRVRAPYEIAYRISFESRERTIAASTTAVRWEPFQRTVARVGFPPYVFVSGSAAERAFLESANGYRRIAAGPWSVYVRD